MTLNIKPNLVIGMAVVLQTKSSLETIKIGKQIGSLLNQGDIVALIGELGSGKTQFIKGLASGAGVKKSKISSPSFILINEYSGRIPFYHIDLYRINEEREAGELGLEEYFESEGITAIEWADKIPSLLPRDLLMVRINYEGKNSRTIEITGRGKRYEELVKEIRNLKYKVN